MFNNRFRNQSTKRQTTIIITSLLFLIIEILSGCVSFGPTKPNEMYDGPYPSYFQYMKKQNALLAEEIGKLPEIKDGIQDHDESALKILCNVYKDNSKIFDDVFIQMYGIGLPKVRRYCSPLQALFWIAKKGDSKKLLDVINNYALNDLLDRAWKFGPSILTDQEISEILEGITDSKLKAEYLRNRKQSSNLQIQRMLLIDYRFQRSAFSKRAKKLLKSKNAFKHPLWSDYDKVSERLNSPELVDYYEKARMRWVDWRTLPSWPVSSQYVFKNGKGDCTAIADFTAACLSKGGYKAYEYKVAPTRAVDSHHSICVYFANGIKYVMDNGRPSPRGILPYDKYRSHNL